MSKIIKFPVTYSQRKRNSMGVGYVPCEVSNRWLQFPDTSCLCEGGEFIQVDVMTLGKNEEPRKICEVILARADLERALQNVKPAE